MRDPHIDFRDLLSILYSYSSFESKAALIHSLKEASIVLDGGTVRRWFSVGTIPKEEVLRKLANLMYNSIVSQNNQAKLLLLQEELEYLYMHYNVSTNCIDEHSFFKLFSIIKTVSNNIANANKHKNNKKFTHLFANPTIFKQPSPSFEEDAKIVILDFDGTMTQVKDNKMSIWERIWKKVNANLDYCHELHADYRRHLQFGADAIKKHKEWCEKTSEVFRTHQLTKRQVFEVADEIELIEGFNEFIDKMDNNNIILFILSGCIKEVIHYKLSHNTKYFHTIVANSLMFDNKGNFVRIIGTDHDDIGKAEYINNIIIEKFGVHPSNILFIGDSENDIYVAKNTMVRNVCINDSNLSATWQNHIRHFKNFNQLYKYIFKKPLV